MQRLRITGAVIDGGLEPLETAFNAFLKAFPAYATTDRLDALRATEYARLDQQGQVYLDYTGGGLYAESQLREHVAMLTGGVFGNPHSKNLTSMAMTERVEQTREYVLRYFNASPDEYMVIFTPNATGALKLIGESYPFGPGDNYLLTFDNHNSVNGIREFARAKGATVTYIPVAPPELRADQAALARGLALVRAPARTTCSPTRRNRTSPACSTRWSGSPRRRRRAGMCCWTRRPSRPPTGSTSAVAPRLRQSLVLQDVRLPDWGRAALLARKAAVQKLQRPWYAGGTITFSSVVAMATI